VEDFTDERSNFNYWTDVSTKAFEKEPRADNSVPGVDGRKTGSFVFCQRLASVTVLPVEPLGSGRAKKGNTLSRCRKTMCTVGRVIPVEPLPGIPVNPLHSYC